MATRSTPVQTAAIPLANSRKNLNKIVDWNQINDEISDICRNLAIQLNQDVLSPSEASAAFERSLQHSLSEYGVIKRNNKCNTHRPRPIEIATTKARKIKNENRHLLSSNPQAYLQMVRAHNKVSSAERKWKLERSTIKQERAFWKNRWSFAKSVVEGSQPNTKPSFSSAEAYTYYSNSFAKSANDTYKGLPHWIGEVMPESREKDEFNTTPFTKEQIWRALKKSNKSSAPGDDNITYHHLWKLPSTHAFLASLFNKIIASGQPPPNSWSCARIRLIYKGSDTSSPSNFRPIALSSCIGKLLNKIIATRMESFLLRSDIINPSTQKGFLRNLNGVVEHIHALNAILDQARERRLPLSITFLDLKNAFGSIPHDLITDMLQLVRIPEKISNYIRHCYRNMTAYIHNEEWTTSSFSITQGVFQGDTLSPVIFLLAFSPLIHLAETWEYAGFFTQILIPNSENLPPIGQPIYVLWEEEDSEEPTGWYKATTEKYHTDGKLTLLYSCGSTEVIDISVTQWRFARKNGRAFIPSDQPPPPQPKNVAMNQAPQYIPGLEHKCKGYADDLTIINSDARDHQEAIQRIERAAGELGLFLKPSKCVSMTLVNGKVKPDSSFPLQDGSTRSIMDYPTKFLGQIVTAYPSLTKREASKRLQQKVEMALKNIDERPIRGEMKVWIVAHYLIPSLHFHLQVNPISSTLLKKLEQTIGTLLKKWLKLPRNATQAILYHPSVLAVPSVLSCYTKAKVSYMSSILASSDPAIIELNHLIDSPAFLKRQEIPTEATNCLHTSQSNAPVSLAARKRETRKFLKENSTNRWNQKLSTLCVQSKFLNITELETENHLWRRIMDGLPSGQLSFMLRAGSDTLPTPMNLQRYKIQVSSRCKLCQRPQTATGHILSACPEALEQGRYTWRHDSVLLSLTRALEKALPHVQIYADLDNMRALEHPPTTIPPGLTSTSSRPDIVCVNGTNITLLELTVSGNSKEAMNQARERKQQKRPYLEIINDLHRQGLNAKYDTIEIGALGHCTKDTQYHLSRTFPQMNRLLWQRILDQAGEVAIACSKSIFLARNNSEWREPPLLSFYHHQ